MQFKYIKRMSLLRNPTNGQQYQHLQVSVAIV
jgi:hypothetical protein